MIEVTAAMADDGPNVARQVSAARSIGSNGSLSGRGPVTDGGSELGGTDTAIYGSAAPAMIVRGTQRNRIESLTPELPPAGSRSVMVAIVER
ncbi:hypothetical protein GCM10023074_48560 [Microbispora amethystogenes]|uniref:Uncharacterized protein n=1 Tax=Microbispora amethystogenes TaxID=1427754 RepID=A0ABQ4FFR2_9ACTN|nr:hypothetical protein Mam01_38210 [Microbispora amethystogenes]